jgi:exopolysaccharide production protein ExoQ
VTSLIATVAFLCVMLGFFALDREPKARTSRALWIPVVWFWIACSRNVSEWLSSGAGSVSTSLDSSNRYLDGNPLDRNVMTALLALGLVVLWSRRRVVGAALRSNLPILLFFLYCAVSSLWSEHPDVSIKRWVKGIADLVMVLVVLTDRDRLTAIKRLLARVGFLFIPLSILLIRYYSDLGRAYNPWDGGLIWIGVTTTKNQLGMICLVLGLPSAWRVVEELRKGKANRRTGSIFVHSCIIVMAFWLIHTADSMTPFACFVLAGFVIVMTSSRFVARKPALVHLVVGAVLSVAFSALFLHIGSGLLANLGRDSTLTGRTDIWDMVIAMTPNRLLGAGYESFWVGERLRKIWAVYWNHPNQAHNGYLEIYLNLGWVGVTLLAVVIMNGYRQIIAAVRRKSPAATLCLGYFVAVLAYNFTESAFKMTHPVWLVFLLATTMVPEPRILRRAKVAAETDGQSQSADLQLVASKVIEVQA